MTISPANPHTILAAHGNDGTTIVLKNGLQTQYKQYEKVWDIVRLISPSCYVYTRTGRVSLTIFLCFLQCKARNRLFSVISDGQLVTTNWQMRWQSFDISLPLFSMFCLTHPQPTCFDWKGMMSALLYMVSVPHHTKSVSLSCLLKFEVFMLLHIVSIIIGCLW